MLSRVADSLYWMSRYLERAEHTARLIDVDFQLRLDQSPDAGSSRWLRLERNLLAPPNGVGLDTGSIVAEQQKLPALRSPRLAPVLPWRKRH